MRKASFLLVFGILITCVSLVTVSLGQDDEQAHEDMEDLFDSEDNTPPPPPPIVDLRLGDKVVALRDAELKVGRETVGMVRKGEQYTVNRLKDQWISVRVGQTSGWVHCRNLMAGALFDWYRRLPNDTGVTASGQTCAKFAGVLFEIADAGPGYAFMAGPDGSLFGVPMGPFAYVAYRKINIILEKVGSRDRWTLWLTFDPPGGEGMQLPPPPGWTKGTPYGIVQPGQFVVIDASRHVSVNGQPRREQ